MKILILHGPNLNQLGKREPAIYGSMPLATLTRQLQQQADASGVSLISEQSNHEGVLIDTLHAASPDTDFILFNPGGYSHTSIALRDALLSIDIPFIEIHLSNPFARETFRQHSYFSDIAQGVITGLGPHGYKLALEAAINYCNINNNEISAITE